jgi:hypothetical protein
MNDMMEKRKEKDYLYINMWQLLGFIGVICFGIVTLFSQRLDADTMLILALIGIVFMGGNMLFLRFALKKGAMQTRLFVVMTFFLALLPVIIGVIAVYDNKKYVAILSLILTIPVSLLGVLPTFYYGDEKE